MKENDFMTACLIAVVIIISMFLFVVNKQNEKLETMKEMAIERGVAEYAIDTAEFTWSRK